MHTLSVDLGSTLLAELASIRDLYTASYTQHIERVRRYNQPYSLERLSDIKGASLLKNRYRVDIAWGNPFSPSIVEVLHPAHTIGIPAETEAEEAYLKLGPLSWQAVTAKLEYDVFDFNVVTDWFQRWLGSEVVAGDDKRLAGFLHAVCVHSPSCLTIDFGSAPLASMLEFIELTTSPEHPLRLFSRKNTETVQRFSEMTA